MKNITKIITTAVLCASLFASAQRVEALGGNAAFWPGDEANIATFPAQINNHAYTQFTGVGDDGVGADLVFNHNGTAWSLGFTEDDRDSWFNLGWGKNGMGINVSMTNADYDHDGDAGNANFESSGFVLSYGNSFDWGELGVHYVSGTGVNDDGAIDNDADWAGNGIYADYRNDCGWWVFTDMVATLDMPDAEDDDMSLTADWFTHWDASGADVLFAMGVDYDTASADGGLTQTATVGVESSLTDWATFRASHTWSYALMSEDDVVGADDSESWSMGLGFNWGGFNADFTLSDAFFGDPLGYMAGFDGDTADDDMWGACTLTYSF